MIISPRELAAEYVQTKATWPFTSEVNDASSIPGRQLCAIDSSETNLPSIVGDGGHGYGLFQFYDRLHQTGDTTRTRAEPALVLAKLQQAIKDRTRNPHINNHMHEKLQGV